MKIFRFGPQVGKNIDQYKSSGFILSKIVHLSDEAFVNCAYLAAEGWIGYHQAAAPQLFLVVQGAGWVRSKSSDKISIKTGQAAYWEKGEWHESGTETGMTAIIIEGGNFEPTRRMPMIYSE
jgi:quercetin dioxygenase-like cupin family protein